MLDGGCQDRTRAKYGSRFFVYILVRKSTKWGEEKHLALEKETIEVKFVGDDLLLVMFLSPAARR